MRFHIASLATSAVALSILAGCATPHVVEASRTSDANLSCSQLDLEMKESERFKADAQKEKGMTGTNVAAVIFFWPAMIGTYSNANEAIAAADTRKSNLMRIYDSKGCANSGLATGGAQPSAEARLKSLRDMLGQNLINQTEYDERRAKILNSM